MIPLNPINTFLLPVVAAIFFSATTAQAGGIVNVYSARKEALIKPLLDDFSAATGIQVNLITGKADALLKRLQVEGSASPADLFITVDAGRLHRAKESGMLKSVSIPELEQIIPLELRDSDNYWYGLTLRARPIIYAKDRVSPGELSTYEGLADAQWNGRICLRSSQSVYNQSLVAATIDAIGAEATQQWMQGMVNNLAKQPSGGDTDQLKAVAAGVCDVTIANTYYLGRLINSSKAAEQATASKLSVFWPNQSGRGAHFNVSGVGFTKYGQHPEQAKALVEFLVSDRAQAWYADINNEYPVVEGVAISPALEGFGPYKMDPIALEILGQNNRQAVQLMDLAGWR